MMLIVNDHKIKENSFFTNEAPLFPLLKEIDNTYGEDFVVENWDALISHQKVELVLAKDHVVTIQIEKD